MDNIFINHLKDLERKSYETGRFMFSDFLSLDEQSELKQAFHESEMMTLFGGTNGCERVIVRFGDKNAFGYEEDFPITCIKASPVLKKFADELSHRDYLGSLMGLGIERKNIGDIIVRDKTAYIFCIDRMVGYITESLTKVKHTVIKCEAVDTLPDGELYKTNDETVIVASMRLDCIIASVYDLSRSKCAELFTQQKVFVNGKLNENTSHTVKAGDIISVRGFGRFIADRESGITRKGRIALNIKRYI